MKKLLRVIGCACLGVGGVPFVVFGVLYRVEGLDVLCLIGGGLLIIVGAILRYAGDESRTVDPPPG
jgi:hypothetical protein